MLLILALLVLVPGILIALFAPDKHPEDKDSDSGLNTTDKLILGAARGKAMEDEEKRLEARRKERERKDRELWQWQEAARDEQPDDFPDEDGEEGGFDY